jgi:spermidine synthase
VIALRKYFAIPEDDSRFRVLQADAADFVTQATEPIDVMLVDAFDAVGLAHSLMGRNFLLQAYAALGSSGVLVMNLAGEVSRYADLIEEAQDIFNRQTVIVSVKDDSNYVLFAFREPSFKLQWPLLKEWAKELKVIYNLDFPSFLQKMARATQGGIVQKTVSTIRKHR